MDPSTWLAMASALLFTLGRLRATGGFTRVPEEGPLTPHVADTWKRIEQFELRRAALLVLVNTSLRNLERTREEIAVLRGIFEIQPRPVRTLLAGYTFLFSECLPRVEAGICQGDALRHQLAQLHPSPGLAVLIRHTQRWHELLRGNQVSNDNALYVIKAFNAGILHARASACRAAG